MKKCIKCGAELPDEAKFCGKCGAKQEPQKTMGKIFCMNCGAECAPGQAFCFECGTEVPGAHSQTPPSEIEFKLEDNSLQAQFAALQNALDEQALSAFEYEQTSTGKYVITGLKDKYAKKLTVPATVETIADNDFASSRLLEAELPEGLVEIGVEAFKLAE